MVPPEVINTVHTALLLVAEEGAHHLPPEGTGLIQPTVVPGGSLHKLPDS